MTQKKNNAQLIQDQLENGGTAADIAAGIIERSKSHNPAKVIEQREVNANPAYLRILEKVEKLANTPSKAKGKTPKPCACGCKNPDGTPCMTKGGEWLPGHDAKALHNELVRLRAEQAKQKAA